LSPYVGVVPVLTIGPLIARSISAVGRAGSTGQTTKRSSRPVGTDRPPFRAGNHSQHPPPGSSRRSVLRAADARRLFLTSMQPSRSRRDRHASTASIRLDRLQHLYDFLLVKQ